MVHVLFIGWLVGYVELAVCFCQGVLYGTWSCEALFSVYEFDGCVHLLYVAGAPNRFVVLILCRRGRPPTSCILFCFPL